MPNHAVRTFSAVVLSTVFALNGLVIALAQPATSSTGKALAEQECGACHMAYPPALLPSVSWLTILLDLTNHFGENAGLDPETVLSIADYLTANAADASGSNSPALQGIDPASPPLRITETPFWLRRHHEVSEIDFARPSVKSKSNCLACHG